MTGEVRRALLALGVVLAAALPLRAAGLKAELSQESVPLGATVELYLTLEGDAARGISLPDFPRGLEVLGTSQSSHVQIVNGRVSRTTTVQVQLRAVQVGRYTLPPATGRVAGRTVESESLTLEVVEPDARPAPPPEEQEKRGVFAVAAVEPERVYVGEPLGYTSRVYLREGHRHARPPQSEPGRFEGFRVDEQEFDPTRGRWVDLASGRFSEFTVDKKILVPLREGEQVVLPGQVHVVIERERQGYRRRGSLFGFFRDASEYQRGALEVPPRTVQVLPLPDAGRPPGFSGVVGRELTARAGVETLEGEVGEPLEYRITLSGRADLRGLKDPQPRFPSSVTVFESKGESSLAWGSDGPRGEAVFEYVLVPSAPGELELPGLELSWFDGDSGTYRTLRARAPAVRVTGTAAPVQRAMVVAPSAGQGGRGDEPAPARTIRFLREDPGELPAKRPPFHRRPGSLGLLGALLLAAAGVELWARRRERFAGDALGLRASRALAEARRTLAELAQAEDSREAYGGLQACLREYVAAKGRRPAPGRTREELEELLRDLGASPELAARGLELVDRGERGRYAPADTGDLASDLEEARSWLDEVERSLR